jgi:hypothetical protein
LIMAKKQPAEAKNAELGGTREERNRHLPRI